MKRGVLYILKLQFAPALSSFLFDHETWGRLKALKKYLKQVDPGKNHKIIDVGGGIGRLELALNRQDVHIYDVNPDSIKTAKEKFHHASVGSGSNIIFEDNYFDYAISIHTLEHVPQKDRRDFIMEMIRVAKFGIYLNFPAGTHAELLCKNYLESLKKKRMPENKWTLEHLEMGLPRREDIEKILQESSKFKFKFKPVRNYKTENYYWTRIQGSKSIFHRVIISPILSVVRYLYTKKEPSVELILTGTSELVK